MFPLSASKGEASASRDQVLLLPNGVEHPSGASLLRIFFNKGEGHMNLHNHMLQGCVDVARSVGNDLLFSRC